MAKDAEGEVMTAEEAIAAASDGGGDSDAEQAAMDVRLAEIEKAGETPAKSIVEMGGLGNEEVPSPLEASAEPAEEATKGATKGTQELSDEAKAEGGDAPDPASVMFYDTGLTVDEVVSQLGQIEGIRDEVAERVTQSVMGKFGEIGRDLKELRERGVQEVGFDPAALEGLKGIDEPLYQALIEALPKGLKGAKYDVDASVKPIVEEMLRDQLGEAAAMISDSTAVRLVESMQPDYPQILKEKEFADFLDRRGRSDSSVLGAFQRWNDDEHLEWNDPQRMLTTFQAYTRERAEAKAKAAAKADALKRATVSDDKAAAPVTQPILDEDGAFEARLKELGVDALPY